MSPLAGTRRLIRLVLRLDRVRLPLWIAAFGLLTYATGFAFEELYPTAQSRRQFEATLINNPALIAIVGPAFDLGTIGGLVAWRLGGIASVLAGVFGLLTVTRHTRAEEAALRQELVMSAAVGRMAPPAAALAVAFGASLGLGASITAALAALRQPLAGSIALGLAVASVGMTLAGLSAIAAQLTENPRTASTISGALLAAAYLLRAIGDSASTPGMEQLSFASPVGWAQQVRPFAAERWWIFGMFAILLFICIGTAYVLIDRRDLGAGIFQTRRGPARAGRLLSSPMGLGWRVHRSSLAAWTAGFALAGAAFGTLAEGMEDLLDDTPQLREIFEALGGGARLEDIFFSSILGLLALIASAYAIQGTLRLRSDESAYRAELVLSTPTGRIRWVLSHLLPVVLGVLTSMLAAGFSAGLVHGLRTGGALRSGYDVLLSAAAHVPPVLVMCGLTLALFGLAPRLHMLAWAALVVFLLLGQLGSALQLDQWILNLSPFTHVPVGAPGLEPVPTSALLGISSVLAAAGLAGFRKRDVA